MEHRKVSNLLIGAGSLATLGGCFLFFVEGTVMAREYRDMYPELAHLYWPGLIYIWVIGLVYCCAMAEYFLISARIGQDRSFCRENARDLKRIALLMILAGALWALAAVLPAWIEGIQLGPAFLLFLLASLASLALGLLAWGLSRLLRRAVEMKEENDLTV